MPGDLPRPGSSAAGRGNPFPGLRPFESHESALFFGRDEQCDELLARLGRRRLVAVVGASGSGKSSLVRAGLLPALQRGYMPSAGSSWQIAIFRPGGSPIANLIDALLASARDEDDPPLVTKAALGEMLASSSLGLVAASRHLLGNQPRSLLVLVDQFEEIFRFRGVAGSANASEDAVECVDLLLAAAAQDDVPVYVVLTMRSDYLGDCARFAGLPEALNDSQFLVPHMTREQLRAAIEGPVAVGGGRIAPGLVQRLLYDVDALAGRLSSAATPSDRSDDYDYDQLPVLQHALMRMWEVAGNAVGQQPSLDLDSYEPPPVETIHHALDRHADEIYAALPSDYHRGVARLVFQRLTERDADNREVRRPTPFSELVAIAVGAAPAHRREETPAAVGVVVEAFAADGRAFVVVNAQRDVDIAHESFIRKWRRLRGWLQEEAQSRRIFLRLAETAGQWQQKSASLYRGPELLEADRWWQRESPSLAWAERYDPRLTATIHFLNRSRFWRRARLSALAAGLVAIVAVSVMMTTLWLRARAAEANAQEARQGAETARNEALEQSRLLTQSRVLLEQAEAAARAGDARLADSLRSQSQARADQADQKNVFTPSETREIEQLRKRAADATAEAKTLRDQLAELNRRRPDPSPGAALPGPADTSAGDAKERELNDKLSEALAQAKTAGAERDKLKDELTKLQTEHSALKARSSDNVSPASVLEPGSPGASFESGVRAYDLGNYVTSVRYLQEALDRQSRTKQLPKEVRLSGTRFVPYAPHAYLAVTLLDMKADCAVIVSSLKNAQAEPAPAEIRNKLQRARAQCGLAP